MRKDTCPACGQRRARRACPALGRQICAVCCGTKRQVEIACPPDCSYLSSARQHPAAVVQRRHEREARFLAGVVDGLSESQYRLFLFLQMAITGYAPQSIPALVDRDVAEAARAMADTTETAARGIIYEHQATSLPAQRLLTELKTALETLRQNGRGPREGDLALALRCAERAASGAEAALGGGRAYLDLLGNLFRPAPGEKGPSEPAAAPPGPSSSRLIIP